jgi:hypothetical protein
MPKKQKKPKAKKEENEEHEIPEQLREWMSLVEEVKADNPEMTYKQVLQEAKAIKDEHEGNSSEKKKKKKHYD